jgi:hypothetical protein
MASRHHTVPDLPVGHVELLSGNDAWHNAKAEAERHRVMCRVKDNHHKDRFYLSNPNKNWGENELHRAKGVSAHPEKLRGGVFTSKAGQQWGFNRLKERVNELNIRASASFGQEANMPSPAKLPGKTDSQAKIEEALSQLYDSVQASEYSNVQSNAQKVLSALYEGGDQLGSSLIADYSRNTFDIRRDMVALMEGPTEYSAGVPAFDFTEAKTKAVATLGQFELIKAKRKIKATLPVIDRILRLLDVIAKVANLSQPERRQAIDASKGRDLREAEKRFVNTEAFTAPGVYDEGTTKAVRGPTGERTGTELEQGIRPIPTEQFTGVQDVERARRYRNMPDFGDFANMDNASAQTGGPEGPRFLAPSVSSSMEARQAQRPGFYEGPPAGRGKGGCHSCDEMEGGASMTYEQLPRANQMEFNTILNREKLEHEERTRRRISPADLEAMKERILQRIITRRNLQIPTGAGVGDGPVNQDMAKSTFYERMGRYPNSDEELMEFMKSMNEKAQLPVDEGFAPKGGRRRKPMTARDKRLAGRGKPRETEASRLLKELDEADDDQLTGGSKKKNTSRHYV